MAYSKTDIKDKNGKYQHLVDTVFKKIDSIKNSDYRKKKIETIKASYRTYNQHKQKTSVPFKDASNEVMPFITIAVDNTEPRLVAGLVGRQPYLEFEMEGLTEKPEPIRILEDWFNDELETTVNIKNVSRSIVHRALLEGTVYPVVQYDEDEVVRREFVFEDKFVQSNTGQVVTERTVKINEETGEPETVDRQDKIFIGGRVEFADFSDVFIPDDAEDWESTDVIRIVRPTYGDLVRKKDVPGYMNIGNWLLAEESEGLEKDEEGLSPSDEVTGAKVTGNEVIECYECFINYVFQGPDQDREDITDWEPKRYIALITKDTKCLIRFEPLINLNFKNQHLVKRVRLFAENGKAYGSSMYEKLRSIQDGSSDMFNMVVNSAYLCMMPWFFYQESSGLQDEIELKLGGGIKVDDVNALYFPRFNQNPRSYITFIEMFQAFAERLSSIGDIQVGKVSETSADVTATETLAAIQEGNIKHNYHAESLKNDFVSVLKTLYDLYYQKMPYDAYFIRNGTPTTIPREDMRRQYKFKLKGSSDLSNKVIQMKQAEGMYKQLRQDPIANPIKLLTDLVTAANPDAPPAEYIAPEINQLLATIQQNPEIMQVIQKYLQTKQQQQMQAEQMQRMQQAQNAGAAAGNVIAQTIQGGGINSNA